MYKTPVVSLPRTLILVGSLVMTACGGGGSGVSTELAPASATPTATPSETEIIISGAGIKGPLAFANVELYALDARFPELYEPGNPVAVATTDAYAQITGLSVSRNLAPPYVMVIDGTNAIDRNTGVAPVISKLITVISAEALKSGQPVYATPYTTLAYQMLRLESHATAAGVGGYVESDPVQHLITLEAEHYANNLPQQGQEWKPVSESGVSGDGAMQAVGSGLASEPDYSQTNPQLDFPIVIGTPGKYYAWVRVIGAQSNSNSLHIGLDNQQVATGEKLQFPEDTAWAWQGGSAAANVDISEAGAHTLNLWVRESGVIVDKIVLTTDPNYVPSGKGPYESGRVAGSSERQLFPELVDDLNGFNRKIIESIGFGMPLAVSIFTTPPLITQATADVASQQMVVQHRAAIEAFSSMLHQMYMASPSVTTDNLIQDIALDLHNDGAIDGKANNETFGDVDLAVLAQDPMKIQIANTGYSVAQIMDLMDEEMAVTGSNTHFYKEQISLASTSTLTSRGSSGSRTARTGRATPASSGGSLNQGDSILHVDFNNRPVGRYAKADIKADFQFGMNGYNEGDAGMDFGSLDIVPDPEGTSRQRVLRVKRKAGRAGAGSDSGGMHFRADFDKHEDVYLAYDMYLPENHRWVKIQKNPSLITNTVLRAGHAYGVTPEAEGLDAFSSTITSTSPPAWSTRGSGAMSAYYYDADEVQANDFWNINNPSAEDASGQYNQPLGYWITVEMRVKMNTVTAEGVSGLKDGLLEVWVTDPRHWGGARKVSSQKHRWRITKTMGVDGIKMQNYYGGSPNDDDNKAPKDQYHYYDNFIVSTKPITH